MKSVLLSILIVSIILIAASSTAICEGGCTVKCKHGDCQVTGCDDNAICKCNWLGNPVCKCSQKGSVEEVGDVVESILKLI